MSFRPIIGKPRLIQDWGEEQHERETHWTSLFYDLILVAALNAIAEPFEEFEGGEEEGDGESPTLTAINYLWLDAVLQFCSVVNPWNALNEMTSMFEDETLVGHLAFFLHCFGLAATTAGCVGELSENYKVLGTGIVLAKLGLLLLYARPIVVIKRARVIWLVRCGTFVVNMLLILWGMSFEGPDAFQGFRKNLIAATIWDWVSILFLQCLSKGHRVPIHIQSYSDRIKEVTMVIFGEAIFAIILQPYHEAKLETHYYAALASTLWVIYALALQEFHIMPSVEDHALRRSMLFGSLWYYTQFFKQICLLGLSIGIKRAHLLTFVAPSEPIDRDTRTLLVWGFSLTMFAVVLIRAYSFGFGRHPSKDDPFEMYWLKTAWWIILSFASLAPQIVDRTILQAYQQPLSVLIVFGCMMICIILVEAAMSNAVGAEGKKHLDANRQHTEEEVEELTYLPKTRIHTYSSLENSNEGNRNQQPPTAFLSAHAPGKTQTTAGS